MEKERICRTERLIGEAGCAKLVAAKVAVIGLGGVGSYAAEALARTGIGTLLLVDFDAISASNINRQIIALGSTIGCDKITVMAERIADINPLCQVQTKKQFVEEKNIAKLHLQQYDFVVDAIDFVPGKIAIIQYCCQHQIPLICSLGTGNKLHPELLKISDIHKTNVCPLAKAVRKKLREKGIAKGVPVLYSEEIPISPGNEAENGKRVPGSISFVPSVAGLLLAAHVVNTLLQK